MTSPSLDTRAGRRVVDIAVVVALASALYQAGTQHWEPAVRFTMLGAAMVAARRGAVPAPFAGAFAVLILLATWASVQHWYRYVAAADEVVHLLTPGAVAAAGYFVMAHHRLLPLPPGVGSHARWRPWAPVVWVTLVGVLVAVVWEFYEWVIEQLSPSGMIVGYTDTVVDLMAGTVSSLVFGALVVWWARAGAGVGRLR